MKSHFIILLALALLASTAGAVERSRVGMNAGWVAPYMPSFPFNDRMKSAEYGWKNGETQVWGVQPGSAGEYTVLYDGGTPVVTRGGTLTPVSPGRWKLVTKGGELKIRVPDTSKVIQILGDASKPGHAFTDAYLASKAPFDVIRLLDIQHANNANANDGGPLTWANRPKVSDQFWSGERGAPLEPWIAWAAEKPGQRILHFTIPHTATKDYVTGLAKACAEARIRVRIEFSNETWNTRTKAGGSMWQAAGDPKPDGGVPALARAAGLSTTAYTLKAAIETGRVFREHMPAEAVEVVFAVQIAAGADSARAAWNTVKPAAGDVQLLAVAPYMSDSTTSTDPKVHAANYLAKAKRWQASDGDTMRGMPKWVALARDTGCRLICYEANNEPKLGLSGTALAAQQKAQDLPDTAEAIGRYIDALRGHGVEELMMFVDFGPRTSSNTFDVSNHPTQFAGAKFLAVVIGAGQHRIEDGFDVPDGPTTDPTTQPSTQPSTQPTTQPTPPTIEERVGRLEERVRALEGR